MEFLNALHVILCLLTSCSPRPDAKVTDVNHDVKNDYHSIDNATLSSSTSVVSELPDNAENDISDLWRNKVVNPRLKRQIMQVALGYSPPDVKYENGEPCAFNPDCSSDCCTVFPNNDKSRMRQCSPLALKGQNCSTGQLKGGLYYSFCPCQSGDVCERGICTS